MVDMPYFSIYFPGLATCELRKEYLNAPPISKNMPPRKKKSQAQEEGVWSKPSSKLYTLVVYLMAGPISDGFEDKIISRTIQIRGDQTLEDLHKAIFKASNRFDSHLYEFNLGEGPDDGTAVYSLPMPMKIPELDEEMAGDVRTTTIDSLGLEVGRAFGYLFDFGDNWLHQINVTEVEEAPGKGRYPKITEKVGRSPPQYPDEDEPNEDEPNDGEDQFQTQLPQK